LTGAGISVTAGIPDFRSPKIGLYAILKEKFDMKDPTEIFSISTFLERPEIFYEFAREYDMDKYDPTLTHYFISYIHNRLKLMSMYYTQNIDGLELKAGLPSSIIVPAHGNSNGARCPKCKMSKDIKKFKENVEKGTIYYCEECGDVPVKPNIVFFGEQLPNCFHENLDILKKSDLGIIVGSSMVVSPFNILPTLYR
jgi:NAD-dependent SIR2 family protein deacetylase